MRLLCVKLNVKNTIALRFAPKLLIGQGFDLGNLQKISANMAAGIAFHRSSLDREINCITVLIMNAIARKFEKLRSRCEIVAFLLSHTQNIKAPIMTAIRKYKIRMPIGKESNCPPAALVFAHS